MTLATLIGVGVMFTVAFYSTNGYSQPATASASDPAQNYNLITRDKFSNSYTLIGGYKVNGNPYLYGGTNEGTVYARDGSSTGILSYNTFNQQVENTTTGSTSQPTIRDVKSVDSFSLTINTDVYKGEMKFINASQWDAKNKFFVQEVARTSSYALYKRFFSTLEVVTTNYIQSELRQFELNFDYYYTDSTNITLKKFKTSESGLKNEFSSKKNCFVNLDFSTIGADKEGFLKSFFQTISTCK